MVDGRRGARQTVDLRRAAKRRLTFSHRFDTPGDHAVEARAQRDALEVDNHRYLVVPVRQAMRVLLHRRPSVGQPFHGATDYWPRHWPRKTATVSRARSPSEVATESGLLERDLGGYDRRVALRRGPVHRQRSPRVGRLLEPRRQPGFLSRRAGAWPIATISSLAAEPAGPRILPARLGEMVNEPQSGLDPLDYRHPIVEAFRGREKAGLLTTPIAKQFRLELPEELGRQVVLASRRRSADGRRADSPRPRGAGGHFGRHLLDRPCLSGPAMFRCCRKC